MLIQTLFGLINNRIFLSNSKYLIKKINSSKKVKSNPIFNKIKLKISNSLIKLLNYINAIIKKFIN
jgi:hypothetical protein